MKFYNREIELAELQRICDLSFRLNSRMTVVTGRRRIGKTSLIKKAFADANVPMLYFFVGRKAEADLVYGFTSETRKKLNAYVPNGLGNMADLFRHLMELAKVIKFTLVIDEFQEFQNINSSVFSDIQNIWDSYKGETHMNLVLSGSVLSMMKKIFTDAHEPLFGRADNIIRLKPFRIDVIKEILSDYHPAYSSEDLLALYAITGGVPKYIELLCDNEMISKERMLDFTLSSMSPFIDEGRNLIITEFGRDYGTYFSVLQAIADGRTSQAEITAALGGMSIGGHLERLENTYNLISKFRPIFAKPSSKNTVRYRIADNFLQFWFRFIEKNRAMIELDNFNDLKTIVSEQYTTYSGMILERYFRQKLAETGGWRDIGQWWEPKLGLEAGEIDIVGIRADNKSALVAEVKRQRRNYDNKAFMAKVERIKQTALAKYEVTTHLFTMDDM